MDRKKRVAAPNSAASKFMSVVSDDLFLDILLRFPDGRSVMQIAAVCKRWYSLIINPYSANFIVRFIQYHLRKQSLDSSYFPAYKSVILFNYSQFNYGPYYQLCSEQPKHYDLSFMLNCGDLAIRAASGDLLLVSRDERNYLICNSLTKQWLALPEVPRLKYFNRTDKIFDKEASGTFGFAIVRNTVCTDEDLYGYKVVIIYQCLFSPHQYNFGAAIFDSETGIWTVMRLSTPYPMNDDDNELEMKLYYIVSRGFEIAVDSNGVMHWLDGDDNLDALFVFDPFTLKSSFVRFPCSQFNDLKPYGTRHRVRLGVVRGRVRLSLMQEDYTLNVWELDSESNTWVLVYDFDLEKTSIGKGEMFFVLAFDPNDGNVLVLVRDEHIYRYEIEQDKCDKVCEFPYDGVSIDVKKQRVADYLKVLTPVHPLWPTPTLSLSST